MSEISLDNVLTEEMEKKIGLPKYDICRQFIRAGRRNNKGWETISNGDPTAGQSTHEWLNNTATLYWSLSSVELNFETWLALVQSQKQAEEGFPIEEPGVDPQIEDVDNNIYEIPTFEFSVWQKYRKKLIDKEWKKETIDKIESDCHRILRKLKAQTDPIAPIKGLVVGNVQSGKTANMAGLMAMAADRGWNMFIVLSGVIENLRSQTETRLFKDLSSPSGPLAWSLIPYNQGPDTAVENLHLMDDAIYRYFTVCLKNKHRLTNLINWLHSVPLQASMMKILIIDDEADQAGINTLPMSNDDANALQDKINELLRLEQTEQRQEEIVSEREKLYDLHDRATINRLIVNLVLSRDVTDNIANSFCSVNYLSYTATPYANVLNEGPNDISLYPSSFIRLLSPSNEYFGPQIIFGDKVRSKMEIIHNISDADVSLLEHLNIEKSQLGLPKSFKDSLCWFLCAAATMRKQGYVLPISMLVHTSQRQDPHEAVNEAIKNYLLCARKDKTSFLADCRQVYDSETTKFSKANFRATYPDYGRTDAEIKDYPLFDQIQDEIMNLLSSIGHIHLDVDDKNEKKKLDLDDKNKKKKKIEYRKNHIHICIDNCRRNQNDDTWRYRLIYPSGECMDADGPYAPVFIIIGGNTLSRGLTLEGLTCSYFSRKVGQADTLMQMGRWFGYRKNYELMPRIWLTEDASSKFKKLAELDEELRKNLLEYSEDRLHPSECGPKLIQTPAWLKITAANKMKAAQSANWDFGGHVYDTYVFDNDEEVLADNLSNAEAFIQSLGDPVKSEYRPAYIWRSISSDSILNFLGSCRYNTDCEIYGDMGVFINWLKQKNANNIYSVWNVAVAGIGTLDNDDKTTHWDIGNKRSVGKINRSNRNIDIANRKILDISSLRDSLDLIADVAFDNIKIEIINDLGRMTTAAKSKYIKKNFQLLRHQSGYADVPLLVIYCINKNSPSDNDRRAPLNAAKDVIGFSILIPGEQRENFVTHVSIRVCRA